MKFVAVATTGLVAGLLSVGSPASAAEHHHTVTITEHQNHRTVTVHPGDRVRVVLHNTYWSIHRSHSAALRTDGAQRTDARPPGSGCVPGAGCGTVTRTFVARHDGTAKLTADRTSCGEAMQCTGDQGTFKVRIRVVD